MSKGGLSRDEIYQQLREADAPCEHLGTPYPSKYRMWGLDQEVTSWGYRMPTGAELFAALFASEAIEWNRIVAFQDVTMRLIAERLLNAQREVLQAISSKSFRGSVVGSFKGTAEAPEPERVFVQDELSRRKTELLLPASGGFHVYVSDHNPGAVELMLELATRLEMQLTETAAFTETSSQQAGTRQLHVTRSLSNLQACDHILVCLNDLTWTRRNESAAFAAEVAQAMESGVNLLLAHEMPGIGQEGRHPCGFDAFFSCDRGTTPQALLRGGIYTSIAIPLRGVEWREASMVMLAGALAVSTTPDAQAGADVLAGSMILRASADVLARLTRPVHKRYKTSRLSFHSSRKPATTSAADVAVTLELPPVVTDCGWREAGNVEKMAVAAAAPRPSALLHDSPTERKGPEEILHETLRATGWRRAGETAEIDDEASDSEITLRT